MAMEIIDNFAMSGKKFLDDRQKWDTLTDLQGNTDVLMPKGFLAFVADENTWYVMDTTDEGDPTKYSWTPFSGGGGQTIQLSSLPAVTDDNKDEYIGKVFQYTGATTDDYTHGWFYQVVSDDTGTAYSWDNVPVQECAGQVIQYGTAELPVPTASAENAGDIIQYVGVTNTNFTTGFFYKCVAPEITTYQLTDVDGVESDVWAQKPLSELQVSDSLYSDNICTVVDGGHSISEIDGEDVKVCDGMDEDTIIATYRYSGVTYEAAGTGYEWRQISVQAEGEEKGAVLKSELTTSVAVGGIEKNENFAEDTPLESLLRKMLAPMTAPVFTFTGNPVGGLKKKGSVVTAPVFTVGVTSLGSNTTRSYRILKGTEEVVAAKDIATATSYTETMADNVTADTTFTCKVSYSDGTQTKTSDATVKYEFVDPLFYGVVDSASPDETEIAALTERLSKTAPFTWSGITMTNRYLCYAYPATMADLKDVRDGNNFGVLSSFAKTTAEINGVSYKVYTTKESSSLNGGKMIFS